MKKALIFLLVTIISLTCFACQGPKSSDIGSISSESSSSASVEDSSVSGTSESSSSTATSTSSKEDNTPDDNANLLNCQLDAENSPTLLEESNQITHVADGIEFIYSNVFESDNGHISLNKAGYLTNLTPLGDLRSVTINYEFISANSIEEQNEVGFGYLKYRIGRNFIDNPNDYGTYVTTVGSEYVIDLSEYSKDYFISFWTPRKIKINYISFTYAEDNYTPYYSDFTIQLFSTNDLHGQIKPDGGYNPGLSKLTANMQSLASQNDQFNIFIDQGDIYQGTAEAGLSYGYNMDDFLLANGYEASTLGNHEFDWGEQRIVDHVNYSATTILANNVRYTKNNSSPEWATPYKLVSRNGVKIGIIGSIGDVKSSIAASQIQGITFLTGNALTEQIKRDSQALKDMGADFIILSIHDGAEKSQKNGISSLPYYDVSALSGSYVDLVLEAHTHQRYKFYDSKGVWHLQNYSNGSTFFLSKLRCKYENGKYQVSLTSANQPTYYSSTSSKNDSIIDEIDNWYYTYKYGKIQSEIVGNNVPFMDDSTFEDLTAKTYYDFGIEMTKGTQYEIVLGGGFLQTRTPYDLAGGTVLYGDIFNLLPFDNDLVLCSISGSDLKSRFLNSTNSSYHIYSSITSSQVVNSKTYYILTDSYTSDYSYNNLTVITNYTATNSLYARDLVAKYLKSKYL